jgi:hypothetical protein
MISKITPSTDLPVGVVITPAIMFGDVGGVMRFSGAGVAVAVTLDESKTVCRVRGVMGVGLMAESRAGELERGRVEVVLGVGLGLAVEMVGCLTATWRGAKG